MKSTQVLRDEHEGILAMLSVVEAAANRVQDARGARRSVFTEAVGFFQNFADKCHHCKEEAQLFPELVARAFRMKAVRTAPCSQSMNRGGRSFGDKADGRAVWAR